jgi:hypothetical protein
MASNDRHMTDNGQAVRQTLRRRGLIAGAAALVAGMAAKQTSPPVRLGKFEMPQIKLADTPPHLPDPPPAPTLPKPSETPKMPPVPPKP